MRRVCVVTGSRAEYGLLRWVMRGIRDRQGLQLQIVATGMHLSPEFGLTYREIESDGFRIDRKVEMLLSSDTPVGIAKSMGLGLSGFADAFQQLAPDVLVVLGDRFEILSAVTAALVARIPVAHLHGGEVTEGVIDEGMRHAMTKMSHLHLVATDEYRTRVIQLGESPDRVFMIGTVGLDNLTRLPRLDKATLSRELDFEWRQRNLLVTFHPVTLEDSTAGGQMAELLAALDTLADTGLIFTMPNADTGGRVLFRLIGDFVAAHGHARAYTSLGQQRYLSCLAQVDGVVGNSSSGLIEAPSMKKGTINIGDRQRGRLRATSVIDCPPERLAIRSALDQLFSPGFSRSLVDTVNPYGEPGASERAVDVLADADLQSILKKRFFDLPVKT
jgi:GDP/UDP-N,N'-diacetylbacillosamine 2-epimerase (hydrolysing)